MAKTVAKTTTKRTSKEQIAELAEAVAEAMERIQGEFIDLVGELGTIKREFWRRANGWPVLPGLSDDDGSATPADAAHDQGFDDRQVLLALAEGAEGWQILEDACREVGSGDPLRSALSAIARQVVRTSIDLEQETGPALETGVRLALGFPLERDGE